MSPRKRKNPGDVVDPGSYAHLSTNGHRRYLRGRRGGLRDMPNMPLDILFEIFVFLHPRDLLNLARTSKDLRALLMSRTSASFWKEARKQFADLPEPPSYLSEPAYVNLLFFPHCHNCLRPNVQTVMWAFSVRYCGPCKGIMFDTRLGSELVDYLPDRTDASRNEYVNVLWSSSAMFCRYHKPEVENIKREWVALQNESEKQKYREQRKAYVAECREYTPILSSWKTANKEHRSAELEIIKRDRFEAIKVKLCEEGYGDVLDSMNSFDHYQLRKVNAVCRPSKLTEKGWNTIRPAVIRFMDDKLMASQWKSVYQTRLRFFRQVFDLFQTTLPLRTAASDRSPGFTNLATMPAIRARVENPSGRTTYESFLEMLPDLPALIAEWEDLQQAVFTEKAHLALSGSAAAQAPALLDLAIVSFSCLLCCRAYRWPHVLAHRCFRRKADASPTDRYESVVGDHVCRQQDGPFRGSELAVFNRHLASSRAIVAACGQDPDLATHAVMEDCGARLVCTLCSKPERREVFDWQAALQHAGSRHREEHVLAGNYWQRISDQHAAQAKAIEAVIVRKERSQSTPPVGHDKVFGCTRCSEHAVLGAMISHISVCHSSPQVQIDRDYYLHEDSKPYGAPSVWMYPFALADDFAVQVGVRVGKGFLAF